tara:strand:+ start:9427 stop:10284 length:858 start_codon:yes stop_codon:yes gene_type:complete
MHQNICKVVIKNKNKFIPNLFTVRQINILNKYIKKKKLTQTEKTYLYSTIKKKIDALVILREEYYINGQNIIKKRVKKAKTILKDLNRNAFISGSFLYSRKYNDIDIYIISNKRKDYFKGNKHFMFITEKDLAKPIFYSALQYSVANFNIEDIKPLIKRPESEDLILDYEQAIIEILNNDDQKMIRSILFDYYMYVKKIVLDSFTIYKKYKKIKKMKQKNKIDVINKMVKSLLLKLYSKRYMYYELLIFLKKLKKTINKYKRNENILIYIDLLTEVKDECRRAQT